MAISEATETLGTESAEERALVLQQLERILAHITFRNSQRYRTFLRYVVEERLQGNTVHLKERIIGVSVFHQPPDYDTSANAVVRVTAGEIRRRLAQYYSEASPEDQVLIELPLGGYVPEFRLRDSAALADPRPHEIDLASFNAGQSQPDAPLTIHASLVHRRVGGNRVWLAGLTGLVLVAAICLWFFATRTARPETEADRILKGAFGKSEVLIVAGPQGWDVTEPLPSADHPDHGFSYTTTRTAAVIGSAVGHAGGTASLLPMQDARLENLQQSPAVLVGAFNNEWTMRLQSPLRYQFARLSGSARGIVDTRDPKVGPLVEDVPATRGYGILARFHSPATGQSTMIAGGLGMHGTAAVRIFLSSPELLRAFAKSAPRGWEERNYEIVLSSDLVNKLADPPKVVHAEFW